MLRVGPLLSFSVALAAALASPAAFAESGPLDPVHVFYDGGDCGTDAIEIQVFDREARRWIAHPEHPRVPVPGCAIEDAGSLLNELRWRCHEADPGGSPPAWRPFRIFEREVMSRCAVAQLAAGERHTAISVTSPGEGVPVRAPVRVVSLQGHVAVDGLEGSDYDVVLGIDRSAPRAAIAAQVTAARAFVEALAPRLGAVRVALLSYPNLPPGPGESAAARRELGWSVDARALDAALARLPTRPVSALATVAEALDAALAELETGRPSARPTLVMSLDGSRVDSAAAPAPDAPILRAAARVGERGATLHWVALGGVAADDPPLVRSVLQSVRGSFRRVPPQAYGRPLFAGIPLPVAEAVWVEGADGGARIAASLDGRGGFDAQVPVKVGANALVIGARTSDGFEVRRPFELVFDDAILLEKILEAERERIHAAQRKRLELRPETAPDAP